VLATPERVRSERGSYAVRPRIPLAKALAEDLAAELRPFTGQTWPNPRYKDDPVAFVEEVLRERPWSKQVEFLEAIRDNDFVAFKAAQKVGKTKTLAWASLWWFCTREHARVRFSSATERQIDEIIWPEVIQTIRSAGLRLDAKIAAHARTGIVAADGIRDIRGSSAREAEAVAGLSGVETLYLIDEASGASEPLFDAWKGNLSAGGKLVLISNPTRTEGQFFRCFLPENRQPKGEWKTLTASQLDTPNYVSGKPIVKGLAGRPAVERAEREWGKDSIPYAVRVLGLFPVNEEKRIFNFHAIQASVDRWDTTLAAGPLRIGIDIAGAGPGGDETVMVARRGFKVLRVVRYRSASSQDILANLRGMIEELRGDDRQPIQVTVDNAGFGDAAYKVLVGWYTASEAAAQQAYIVGVQGGFRAEGDPTRFGSVRDEMIAKCEKWFLAGGAIPDDGKLREEMHAFEWKNDERGHSKATPKEEIRKRISRSPDSFDALCLSCWDVDSVAELVARNVAVNTIEQRDTQVRRVPRMDPYSAENAWRPR
jgi:phage terminase large subunit